MSSEASSAPLISVPQALAPIKAEGKKFRTDPRNKFCTWVICTDQQSTTLTSCTGISNENPYSKVKVTWITPHKLHLSHFSNKSSFLISQKLPAFIYGNSGSVFYILCLHPKAFIRMWLAKLKFSPTESFSIKFPLKTEFSEGEFLPS